ncbi:uncharacterized protein RAG0_09173 [Rhynchosporium agropyri]|uniref:Uncharacterized protein n=1 Tax=Rhynchosporium agropyri TaxID=914238 RepID=A0A1E1KU52_9HELO|nr:uncharacterized protein RAG0_09173 [Rhynchosporium agropyri]
MRFYYRSSHFKPASNDGVIMECLNVPSESKVSKFAFGEAKVCLLTYMSKRAKSVQMRLGSLPTQSRKYTAGCGLGTISKGELYDSLLK